jgi:hypothetical protein
MPQFNKPKCDKRIIKRESVDKHPLLFGAKEKNTLKYIRMKSSASASLQETSSSFDTSLDHGGIVDSEMDHCNDNADENETRDDTDRLESCNQVMTLSSSKLDAIGMQEEVRHSDSEICTKRMRVIDDKTCKFYGTNQKRLSHCTTKIFFGLGLGLPILAFLMIFSQGISLLLRYRHFFGSKAPIPISPSHGVVAALDRRKMRFDTCVGNSLDENDSCRNDECIDDDVNSSVSRLVLNDMEENYHFKTFVPSIYLSQTLHMTPLRLLVIGDSVARGVGQSNSFYPLMPETLGAILSKHHGGRPVFWSAFGEPGATMKWIARQVHDHTYVANNEQTSTESREKVSMEQFWALFQHSDRDTIRQDGNVTNHGDDIQRNKLQWVQKLQYHQQLYEANPFAGYDYIIALSGINDIKRMLVPFLVHEDDEDKDAVDNNVLQNIMSLKKYATALFTGHHEWGFGGDLKRLVRDLHKISNFHSNGSLAHSLEYHNENLPLIIFPSFPARHVPAKTGAILRWIGVKLTGMLDAMKKNVADENARHLFAAPYPDDQETLDFIHKVKKPGSLMDMLEEEEIMIRLIHGNRDFCQRLVNDMKQFYSTRKARQEDNMMASDLFSNDAVHPNDRGYDYFGRYLGKYLLQRWDDFSHTNNDDNNRDNIS